MFIKPWPPLNLSAAASPKRIGKLESGLEIHVTKRMVKQATDRIILKSEEKTTPSCELLACKY